MINKNPLVSVIIPTYNRANFISQSIESILNQTYRNFDILVVDDGSIDGTKQILEPYLKQEVLRYFYKKNEGVSSARNFGIRESKGDYIAFLDSDDIYHHEKLEKQVEYMERYSTDIGMSFTNYNVINENGETLFCVDKSKVYPSEILGLEQVFEEPGLAISTVLIRKEVFTVAGMFDEKLPTAEDIDFFLRVAKFYKIGFLPITLVNIRQHSKGRLSDLLRTYEDLILVYNRFIEQNLGYCNGTYSTSIKNIFSKIYLDYGGNLLFLSRTKEAIEKLKLSISYKLSIRAILLLIKSHLKLLI